MAIRKQRTVIKKPMKRINSRNEKKMRQSNSSVVTQTDITKPSWREYSLEKRRLRNEDWKARRTANTIKAVGKAGAKNILAGGASIGVNTQMPAITNAIISAGATVNKQATEEEQDKDNRLSERP